MVKKSYQWDGGAELDEHSKRKHKILREYFRKYLITRCKHPKQSKFRLAIVDGFSGGGVYKCGSDGSPLIFLRTLKDVIEEINITRVSQNIQPVEIECFLVFNDLDMAAIEGLKSVIEPMLMEIKENHKRLHIKVEYYNDKFNDIYLDIHAKIIDFKYRSVIFNLDQCGYSLVDTNVIKNIMSSWNSAEVFLTFAIQTALSFISKDQNKSNVPLNPDVQREINDFLQDGNTIINKPNWLGEVERIVFGHLKACAPFSSPFSINNPKGWRYWFIHFANASKARQVYNDTLHENSTLQAHFGRSGLHMLSYDPEDEGKLYLFDDESREVAKKELYNDIPKLIVEHGDALTVADFHASIYNETVAHSEDIHKMIIENPDIEVITEAGGERRKSNTIHSTDVLKMKRQASMFPMFGIVPNNDS